MYTKSLIPYRQIRPTHPYRVAFMSVITLGALWWSLTALGIASKIMVPSPEHVLKTAITLADPPQNNAFAYYAFRNGSTLASHTFDTGIRLALSLFVGGIVGILLGAVSAVFVSLRVATIGWLLFYLGGIPRLIEILYVNSLGIIGTSACVLLGGLAIMCSSALATTIALHDSDLKDQVEHAKLECGTIPVVCIIALPQKSWNIAVGLWIGVTQALSLILFTEYVQSTSGLGFLLQIAFGSDVRVAEALVVMGAGLTALLVAQMSVALFALLLPTLATRSLTLLQAVR